MTSASTPAHKDGCFHIFYIFIYSKNANFKKNFVVYDKCWSDCPAGVGLTDHTGPLLALDLVNWQAAQLLSWVRDMCTDLPRLRSRNREGEWRKVSMGLWQGPVQMSWKMPLLLNNLLCCSSLKPTSPAPVSSVEDAFHACWGECTIKMLHGWCQLGLTQPNLMCSVPLLWVHQGPQPDTGTWEMSASVQALQLPLAAPWAALTPELTGFQLHTHMASPPGVLSSEVKLPQEPIQGGQCVPAVQQGEMWCIGRLLPCTGDGEAAGHANAWYFWIAQE